MKTEHSFPFPGHLGRARGSDLKAAESLQGERLTPRRCSLRGLEDFCHSIGAELAQLDYVFLKLNNMSHNF